MELSTGAPGGSGASARRNSAQTHILAIVAIVSVIALIDSEIAAYGVSGIVAAADMLGLPMTVAYGAIGVLGFLVLWFSGAMGRHIWRVEHQLDAAQTSPAEKAVAC